MTSSHPALPVAVGEPSTSSACDQTASPSEQVLEEPENVKIASVPTSSPIETHDFGCQVNTRGESLMLKSVGTQTPDFFDLCVQYTQTEPGLSDEEAWFFNTEEKTRENESIENVSPHKDPSYIPSKSEENDDDEEEEVSMAVPSKLKPQTPQNDSKFLVFMEQLDKLLHRRPTCGAVVSKRGTSTRRSRLCVTLKCKNGHIKIWKSQPILKGMAAGNLLLASTILLSGATYTKIVSLSEILNWKMFSEKTFYNIQNMYLFPVINEAWQAEQNSVFSELEIEDLWLSGDGRCDSPGHSAKYGTYTMIDQFSDKIIDFQIVQVSEVTSSNAMEREGFKRCMENIHDRGANIKVVATDRHVSIQSDTKRIFHT